MEDSSQGGDLLICLESDHTLLTEVRGSRYWFHQFRPADMFMGQARVVGLGLRIALYIYTPCTKSVMYSEKSVIFCAS